MQFDPSAFVADPELLRALEERSIPFPCDDDRVLFRQGDAPLGLYTLHAGKATLVMDAAGAEVVSVETGPGALLGLPAIVGNQPYSLTATAHKGAEVRFISGTDFAAFMHSNPQLALMILQVLAAEVRTARRALH